MAEALASGWCDLLEELVQCPVCLEVPQQKAPVYQCSNGHHICRDCKNNLYKNGLFKCPVCKTGSFIETRNLLAEQLGEKFIDIKLDMLAIKFAEEPIKNENCIGTQTENINENDLFAFTLSSSTQTEDCEASIDNHDARPEGSESQKKTEPHQLAFYAPKIAKGKYPCRLGSCTTELPHARLIGHIRRNHKDLFYQFDHNNGNFTKNWTLNYEIPTELDIAFHITDMGLFFFNITIYDNGDLSGHVQILNCLTISRNFTFKLEVGNGQLSVDCSGQVQSCRMSKHEITKDRLFVCARQMAHMLNGSDLFNCILSIKRIDRPYNG